MSHQYATLEDTVYFWFGANDTSGSGNDGATPVYDVRLGGAAANAIPTLSGAATLLSHANYPAGCHEVAIAATAGNGFAANNTYGVFCTLLVDAQNPTGFVGSFTLGGIPSTLVNGVHGGAAASLNLANGLTANITGNLSGSVGSVTGAVGSVTGAVGSVTGAVGSVTGAVGSVTAGVTLGNVAHGGAAASLNLANGLTANITGNLSGSVGSVTGAVGSVTGAVGSVTGAVGSVAGNVDGSVASVVGAVGSVAGNVDGSVASVTGAVGSVTGNLGGNVNGNVNGNVSGSVGSVTGAVGSVTGAVGSVTGSVSGDLAGDVQGKVLGGGAGVIAGDGVQASSVTGAVGSVTGAVGSVTGAVGSVAGGIGGDVSGKVLGGGAGVIGGDGVRAESVTGAVGSVTGAVGSVTGAVGSVTGTVNASLTQIMGAVLAGNAAQIAAAISHFFDVAVPAKDLNDVGVAGAALTAAQVWEYIGGAGRTLTNKTGFKLASDGVDLIIAEAGTGALADINARQALALIGAACAAVITGQATDTPVILGMNSSEVRISATTGADGRLTVTLTPPA